MGNINVGVIGTGFIGPAHIEALRRLGTVNVVALADVDEQTARAKAAALGVDRYYGDYKKMLADWDIEAVHICTSNNLHYQMSKEAIEAGKHVVCEKPLAISAAEGDELVKLAAKSGCFMFGVGFESLSPQVIKSVRKQRWNSLPAGTAQANTIKTISAALRNSVSRLNKSSG